MRSFLILAAALLTPLPVLAQAGSADALAGLLAGEERIRVHLGSRRIALDTWQLGEAGIAYVDRSANEVLLPYSNVDRIDVRRSAWRTGLIVGSIFGASQAAIAIAIIEGSDASTGRGEAYAVTAGVLFASAGLGALIGAAMGRWHSVYESERPATARVAPVPLEGGWGVELTLALSP